MANLSRRHFYVARHWRGELPLWQSVWVNLVLGRVIYWLVLVACLLSARFASAASIIGLMGVLPYAIWITVGTYRAVLRYPGPRAWSVLARLAISVNLASGTVVERNLVNFASGGVADIHLAIVTALWLALAGAAVIVWLTLHLNRSSSQGGSMPAS